jgi:hypothetical protein
MNSFDIDGVITVGIFPGPDDIIITGRSFEEAEETYAMLKRRGITNKVYFNQIRFDDKTRFLSGMHKAGIINRLCPYIHFEDDPIQWEVIERYCPTVKVVRIVHNLTEKENIRHIGEL